MYDGHEPLKAVKATMAVLRATNCELGLWGQKGEILAKNKYL